MTARKLYANASGITKILSASVSQAHGSAVATLTLTAESTDLDIGDEIVLDLGYEDDYETVFTGYVKEVERKIPEDVYTITAMDKLIRAVDYFVVSTNPNEPIKFAKGIYIEQIIQQVLGYAGLWLDYYSGTGFQIGISVPAEINLVSAFDYCKSMADLVTFSLWADKDGLIYFKNRKPYPMLAGSPESTQPGWAEDSSVGSITNRKLSLIKRRSESDIRNRIVVYGNSSIYKEVSQATTYDPSVDGYVQILPTDYYKSTVASYGFIDDSSLAEKIASYNLLLLNRVGESINLSIEGNPSLESRKVIQLTDTRLGLENSYWYIYSLDHTWSSTGYVCNLELRR